MRSSWRGFLVWRVPLVLLAIVAVGQGLAVALKRVTLRRSYMDDLALAVTRDHTPHRVVLLGDSITLMSTRRFELGRGRHDVVNLATIAWTGAAAELFLLERYLAGHSAPQYVVYASAPDNLQNNDSPQLVHYYDWNVYTLPEERAFMRQHIPGIDGREHFPAILNVQENIVERLLSLAVRSPPALTSGLRSLDPDVRPEPIDQNRMGESIQDQRTAKHLMLGSLQQAVFARICQLSLQYGFQLDIVWPPVPQPVQQAWIERGEFRPLNAQLATVVGQNCNLGPTFDINSLRAYTNFNRDGFHLHGEGWKERYAADLSTYIAGLPDRTIVAEAKLDAKRPLLDLSADR